MDLYLDSGYLNMAAVLDDPHYMRIVVSLRGPGKTFGSLSQCVEKGLTFLYLRNTKTQLDICCDPMFSPFKAINRVLGWNIQPEKKAGMGVFKDHDHDKRTVGYLAALSTIRNVRGWDGSDVDVIIWDEFIPETGERRTFDAWMAFTNAVETVGRNREIEGRGPLRLLLLSNSNNLYDQTLSALHISDDLVDMRDTGEEVREISPELVLIVPAAGEYTRMKQDTALARLTSGSRFSEMAFDNRFRLRDQKRVEERPLSEYAPIAFHRGITIYKHKSSRRWYLCRKKTGTPKTYPETVDGLRRIRSDMSYLCKAFDKGLVSFESFDVQTVFLEIFFSTT